MSVSTILLALFFATQASQPASPPDELAAFRALPTLKKAGLVRRIEKRCENADDPLLARLLALRPASAEFPPRSPQPFHSPDDWAKGVAPARSRIAPGTAGHAEVRQRFPKVPFLDDLHCTVEYDWHAGRITRNEPAATFEARFANLLHGWPPDADAIVARLLASFDRDSDQRPLAEYFEHAWADLDARVYEGISLFDAWCSGATVDVPDVDAIPFAVRVRGDKSHTSPIPANARRTKLYLAIAEAAAQHRRYRSVVLCAAAAALRAEPVLDASHAELVPRFHLVWATANDDLAAVAEVVAKASADRSAFIARLDASVVAEPAVHELREKRKRDLLRMQATISEIARRELDAER